MVVRHVAILLSTLKSHRPTAGLRTRRIAEIGNFRYEFAPKGYRDFSKIWHGGRSPRLAPSRKILPFWFSKCGLRPKKSPEMLICVIHLPKGYIPLGDFYKILPERESHRTALSCEISTL